MKPGNHLIIVVMAFLIVLTLSGNAIAYHGDIEIILRDYFSDQKNIPDSNDNYKYWSDPERKVDDLWSRISGESAQFITRNSAYDRGDYWTKEMPEEVDNIYRDMANDIFGSVKKVNTGFAYDYGYYASKIKGMSSPLGAHEGLDIGATQNTKVHFFTNGYVHEVNKKDPTNVFIFIDELDSLGNKTGRRWKYGHLYGVEVKSGDRLQGQTYLGKTNELNHLHLAVMKAPYIDIDNRFSGEKAGDYSSYEEDVAYILEHRISPVQAYWEYKNSINRNQPEIPESAPVQPTPEHDPESDFTVAVVILIDVSGSMNDYWIDGVKMDSAREAAIQMVDLIETESNIEGRRYLAALVEFSFDANIIQPMTSNFDLLRYQLENLSAAGGTNIGAGLETSFSALSKVPYDRALVIMLSDGMTNQGRNPSQILEWLKSKSILYAPPPDIGLQASSYSYKERLLWADYHGLIDSAEYSTNLLQQIGYDSYLGIHKESSYALGRLPADLVFKFIGHANNEKLQFQDNYDTKTHLISGDIRKAELDNLQLVVLTGCRTAGNIQNRNNILRSFVDAGARVGVGFSDKISIFDATDWSNTFWDKLVNDRLTVSEASLAGTWRGWPRWPSKRGIKRSHVLTYPAGIAHILTIDDMMPSIAATTVEGTLSSPRVYTVGFGDPEDLDEELLRSIASATGGEYFYGKQSSDLANIFIRTQHLGTGTLQAEFEGIIHQGEELSAGSFYLNRGESELRLSLNWPGSFIDLQLVDPRGNTVALDYNDLIVWRKEKPAYMVINKPLPGEWTVKLYGEDIPEGDTFYYVIASTGDLITAGTSPLEFMVVFASLVLVGLIAAPLVAGNTSLGRSIRQ